MFARRRSWLLPVLIGAFVFSIYMFTFPNDIQGNGDTWLRYEMTQSIMDHGTPYYSEHGTPTWTDKRVVLGIDRRWVSIYDPGQMVAMMPGYELGRLIAHHVTGDYVYTPRYTSFTVDDIFGALLAVLVFLMGLRLGYSRKTAALLSLLFAFATTAWADAESFLEHTQVSFFLALSVLLAMIFVQTGIKRRRLLALGGLSIGCAFLTRYDTGILLPMLPLYVAAARIDLLPESGASWWQKFTRSLRDWSAIRAVVGDWFAYGCGVVPAVVAALIWNYIRFGSVAKTGIPPTFGEPIFQGFAGLVVSPGKGLLWYVPVLFALPFVVTRFFRTHRVTAVYFLAIVAAEFVLFSTVIYWHGDPAYGPRYIFPTLPYLVLPLGLIIQRWRQIGRWLRRGFLALVAISVFFQFTGVITPPYRFWYKEIHAQLVAHQGFNWGPKNGHFWYFYYWDVARSPLVVDIQNLYEITALKVFNRQQYNLGISPIPAYEHLNLANPVHSYEINNYNLWWLAQVHPFIGTRVDLVLAALWAILCLFLFFWLRREIRGPAPPEPSVDMVGVAAQRAI